MQKQMKEHYQDEARIFALVLSWGPLVYYNQEILCFTSISWNLTREDLYDKKSKNSNH